MVKEKHIQYAAMLLAFIAGFFITSVAWTLLFAVFMASALTFIHIKVYKHN